MVVCPNIIHQLMSIVGKPWIDLHATELCFTRSRGTWAYTYPPHALCTQDSVRRLNSTVNSPSFPSSSMVPNFVKAVNIDTSQITSKQKNAQTTSVACIPSRVGSIVSLCQNHYLKLKTSATTYISLLCWKVQRIGIICHHGIFERMCIIGLDSGKRQCSWNTCYSEGFDIMDRK